MARKKAARKSAKSKTSRTQSLSAARSPEPGQPFVQCWILKLPLELHQMITKDLSTKDVVHYALSCKPLFIWFSNTLYQLKMHHLYGKMTINKENLWSVFTTVFQTPELRNFMEEARIQPLGVGVPVLQPISRDLRTQYKIETNNFFDKTELMFDRKSNSEQRFKSMVLATMPKLRTLSYTVDTHDALPMVIECIVFHGKPYLQNLTTVTLTFVYWSKACELGFPLSTVQLFALLPSVRSLTASRPWFTSSSPQPEAVRAVTQKLRSLWAKCGRSNVTELRTTFYPSPDLWRDFLYGFDNLTVFEYYHFAASHQSVDSVLQYLSLKAGKSLKILRFQTASRYPPLPGPAYFQRHTILRSFESLIVLGTCWTDLIHSRFDTLAPFLPVSLEQLSLIECRSEETFPLEVMVKSKSLTRLRQIDVDRECPRLKSIASIHGVKIVSNNRWDYF